MHRSADEFPECIAVCRYIMPEANDTFQAWKLNRVLYGFSGPVKGAAAVYDVEDGCVGKDGEHFYFGFGYYCELCKTTFFVDPDWKEGFAHECIWNRKENQK